MYRSSLLLIIGLLLSSTMAYAVDTPKPLLPIPTKQQLEWQELEYIAFAHFGINTFTGREWGDGSEDPKIFNPSEFDAKQWAKTLKEAGMNLLILTCKHHDGFNLWPSAYTEHSIKNSPWKNGQGDLVKEVADACREAGIKFGVYLSPWDRNQPTYGDSPKYNKFFRNQLTELLTNYGEITEVWFDGACGEGPNGKRQVYDWDSYYKVIRKLQPNAVIFGCAPDIRWVGNESGVARETEWSSLPLTEDVKKRRWAEHQRGFVSGDGSTFTDQLNRDPNNKHEMFWYPAESDVSIRPGWFYHKDQDERVKSLDHLLDIYYKSIGRNSVLLLNLPPDQRGLIHENDAARLRELKAVIDKTFETNFARYATEITASNTRQNHKLFAADRAIDGGKNSYWATDDGVTQATLTLRLPELQTINVCSIQEQVAIGQRVYDFSVEVWDWGWKEVARGSTIGFKRLLRFEDIETNRVRLVIRGSRACLAIQQFGLFYAPQHGKKF